MTVFLEHLHHQRRDIVAPRFLQGNLHQPLRHVDAGLHRFRGTQKLDQLLVVKSIHQAVRAEQKNISRLVGHRTDLRLDELVPGASAFWSTLRRG